MLGLKRRIEIAKSVQNPSFTDRNRIHEILQLLQRITVNTVQQRVPNSAKERHVGTYALDDWIPSALPYAETTALRHSRNRNAVRVNLNLGLKNSARYNRVLEHPSKHPGFGFIRSGCKVASLNRVRLLMERAFAVKIKAQRYHSLARSVNVWKFGLPAIRRQPKECRRTASTLGIGEPAVL